MAITGSSFLDLFLLQQGLNPGQIPKFRGKPFEIEKDIYNQSYLIAHRCQRSERIWHIRVSCDVIDKYADRDVANRIFIDALNQLFDSHDSECPDCRPIEVRYTTGAYAYAEAQNEDMKPTRVIRFRKK